MHVLRSMLITSPVGDSGQGAAISSHADALILDLATVPPTALDEARAVVRSQAAGRGENPQGLWVRIHPTGTTVARADIRAVIGEGTAGVVIPSVHSANHVRYVEALLRDAEGAAGLKEGTTALALSIGSADGLLRAGEIARASERVVALLLDGEGFCEEMGISRTRDGAELAYPRAHLAVSARAANVLAIDAAFPFALEGQELLADTAAARSFGLHGKLVLTPEQVTLVNATFRPSENEVAFARRLQEEHEQAGGRGEEWPHLDGRMIDAASLARARRTLELATDIEARDQAQASV